LGTIVQATNIDYEVQYILTCFFIICGAALTVHPLFFQKVLYIKKGARAFDTTSTLGNSSVVSKKPSSTKTSDAEKNLLFEKVEELNETVEILRINADRLKKKYNKSKRIIVQYREKYGRMGEDSASDERRDGSSSSSAQELESMEERKPRKEKSESSVEVESESSAELESESEEYTSNTSESQ